MNVPSFATKKELFDWLRTNKQLLIQQKKYMPKHADPVISDLFQLNEQGDVIKAAINTQQLLDLASFKVAAVINTTNYLDSHMDVHLPGIWNKSLKEQKMLYLLQEHMMSFKGIISDNVKASARMISWKELGYKYQGETQALIFDATIDKDRNEYMAEQYAKNRVKNHSVGMRYVKLELAINSENKYDKEEKAVWDKYIDQIVNRDEAEENGYFWAVHEAKILEGSAVPIGSNITTPTLSIEPPSGTQGKHEPPREALDYDKLIKCFTI